MQTVIQTAAISGEYHSGAAVYCVKNFRETAIRMHIVQVVKCTKKCARILVKQTIFYKRSWCLLYLIDKSETICYNFYEIHLQSGKPKQSAE